MALQTPLVLGSAGVPVEIAKTDLWRPGYPFFQKGTDAYEVWTLGGDSHGVAGSVTGGSLAGLILTPWVIPFRMTLDRTAITLGAGAASATGRIGIYAVTDPQDNLKPGARLFQTNSIDFSSSGTKTETIDWTLNAGWYWIALYKSDTAVTYYPRIANTTLNLGFTSGAFTVGNFTFLLSGGTMDDPCPSSIALSSNSPPTILFRRSA